MRVEPGEMLGATIFGAVGPTGLPKIQLIPTRISVTPMIRMIVPVTTGGKNRSIRLTTGAISIAMTPAPMIAPKIIRAPSGPGVGARHRHHRADRGEGHAHHHRQLDAEPAGEAERLQDRGDAADEQVGRDQEGDVLGRELQRPADDQRHRDGAGIHHQHVLEAEGEELGRGQDLVDGVRGCGHPAGLHWLLGSPVGAGPLTHRMSYREGFCPAFNGLAGAKQFRATPQNARRGCAPC